jgi:hypothetical protein
MHGSLHKKLIKSHENYEMPQIPKIPACIEVGYGIVTFFGPSDPGLDKQLESISTALGIPLISTSPRTLSSANRPAFSDMNVPSRADLTLALFPTQGHLITMIKDLTKELKWKDFSIIHDPMHGKKPQSFRNKLLVS